MSSSKDKHLGYMHPTAEPTEMSSLSKDKHLGYVYQGDKPTEMNSSKDKHLGHIHPSKQHFVANVLSLMRIRDFIRLLLCYPMRLGYEDSLKQWTQFASTFICYHCQQMGPLRSMPDSLGLRRKVELLLSNSPLRYVEGIIPEDIIEEIRNGGSIIFHECKLEELTIATTSTSKKMLLKHVPQPILDLSTRLAVDQLTQTLIRKYRPKWLLGYGTNLNVWFSTRNDAEKQIVVGDIKANFQIRETFQSLRIIDLNQIDEELEVLDLAKWLEQTIHVKDEYVLLTKKCETDRHLVLLVDWDGDKKLDPRKLRFPNKIDPEDVVIITTQSLAPQIDELTYKVDLRISTEDHLLPWEVFCKNVGNELVHSSIDLQRIAVQIVEKCGGHLLAIVLVAKSLSNVEDIQLWELTLKRLLYSNPLKFTDLSQVIVNAFINIIWEDTISERERAHLEQCLRVFEKKYEINDYSLLTCWFLKQSTDSGEEAENILRELLERSILLQFQYTSETRHIILPEEIKIILDRLVQKNAHEHLNEEASRVQMFSQDKVLNLSYTGLRGLPGFIYKLDQLKSLSLRGCKQFKQLPQQIAQLHNLEKLDLNGTSVTHLPPSLNFPNLIILLIGENLDLMEIPPSFFDHMPLLNILDLSCTSIQNLPSSFFNLGMLQELYLKDCELFIELSSEIARLKNLNTLDLRGTQITHLPHQIQELTNLKSLSFSFPEDHHNSGWDKKCMSSSSFAMDSLASLSKLAGLEVLRIDVDPDNVWWHNNVEHVLSTILGFKSLRTLDIYIPEVILLMLIPGRVNYFRLIVGHHKQRIISRVPPAIEVKFKESSPGLKFVNGVDFPDELKSILYFARAFFLDRHMTINNLSQFGLKNLQRLELCILSECNEMHSIVDADGEDSTLPESFRLKFLTIFFMKNLKSIIERPSLRNSTLYELKLLTLHTCPELTTIFTIHFLQSLVNLEELIVEDCPRVSSIISCQSSERIPGIFLPKLKKLSLLYVPELVSISNGLHIGRNLEKMGFYYCPKLASLSTAELSSEKLKVIRGELEWWEALKWSEAEWGQHGGAGKFNHIFSPIDEDLDILTQLTAYELPSFNGENDSDD